MRAVLITLFSLSIGAATPAFAQTDQQKSACRGDAMRLCPSHIGNRDAMRACMKANKERISDACKAAIRG